LLPKSKIKIDIEPVYTMLSKLVCFKKGFYLLNILLLGYSLESYSQAIDFHFTPPVQEWNAFQHFKLDATGIEPVNTFLLAKLSEMMYLERIDYQIRYLQNDQKPLKDLPSSEYLKEKDARVTNQNFKVAFEQRFKHYFHKQTASSPTNLLTAQKQQSPPYKSSDSASHSSKNQLQFHFIHKTAYLDKKKRAGLDPELMVISTQELIIIAYRGTDRVGDDQWGEWLGTDFKVKLIKGGGHFVNTKVHKGFWKSFDLIRDELLQTLDKVNAKNKRIWLTGHSLGGAMAILTGAYLKSMDYPITNVYAFASPRVIGSKKLQKKIDDLLPNRVQRFEYYLDPVTLLWAPRYQHIGQRNWFDQDELGNYQLHKNVKERYLNFWPFHFNRHPFNDKRTTAAMRLHKEMHTGLLVEIPFRFWYHNPQWYVKAAYAQLTAAQRAQLPAVDDSFPYLYDSAKGPMPGSK